MSKHRKPFFLRKIRQKFGLTCLVFPVLLALAPSEPVMLPKGTDPAQFDLVGLAADSLTIIDGEIRLTGKPLGYFATKQAYQDYVLTFEYRFDRPEGLKSDLEFRANSGVLLHLKGSRSGKIWPDCVQVQFAQFDPGAIFAMGESKCEAASSDPKAQKSAIKPVGQWNKIQVTSRSGSLVCLLNGVEVSRAEKANPAQGPIAWQSEESPVRFREIQIKPLP